MLLFSLLAANNPLISALTVITVLFHEIVAIVQNNRSGCEISSWDVRVTSEIAAQHNRQLLTNDQTAAGIKYHFPAGDMDQLFVNFHYRRNPNPFRCLEKKKKSSNPIASEYPIGAHFLGTGL